jgi:hypothetical protein
VVLMTTVTVLFWPAVPRFGLVVVGRGLFVSILAVKPQGGADEGKHHAFLDNTS